MKIPSELREVLGTHQSGVALTFIGLMTLFGCYVVFNLFFQQHHLPRIAWWQWLIGYLLIVDVVAGCAANFTRGTNDYYRDRARARWVFIGVHFHIIAIAWSYNIALNESLIIWAYTIVCAAVLNTFYGKTGQYKIALCAIGFGCVVIIGTLSSPLWFKCIGVLFLIKVCYAFSVDHYVEDKVMKGSLNCGKKNPI